LLATLVSLPMAVYASIGFASSLMTARPLKEGWINWPVIWGLWWLGVVGAFSLCVGIARDEFERATTWWPISLLGVGLCGAELLNVRSARDPSWHISLATAVVPYASLVLLGGALRWISNFRSSGP
jgi:hypothetical protein